MVDHPHSPCQRVLFIHCCWYFVKVVINFSILASIYIYLYLKTVCNLYHFKLSGPAMNCWKFWKVNVTLEMWSVERCY